MPQYLPLFPLSSVVFPGEKLRLHIFEPRYKQLIHECHESGMTFGIPPVIEDKVQEVFTEITLLKIDRTYPNGEMDILTEGKRRAKLLRFDRIAPEKLYPGGEIEWVQTDFESHPALQQKVSSALREMNKALGITRSFSERPEDLHSFDLGHHVGLTKAQEVQLLAISTEKERMNFLLEHLQRILPVLEEKKPKAKLNGHYENLLPPDY